MKSTNKNDGKIYVIPNGRVPDPKTGQALPAEGAWVPNSAFWRRRLNDEDVKKGTPPRSSAKPDDKQKG